MTRVIDVDPSEAITIDAKEAAPMLLCWLEQNGAVVRLDTGQQLRVDLDPLPNMTPATSDRLARLILSVKDEIRELLIARTTVLHAFTHSDSGGVH